MKQKSKTNQAEISKNSSSLMAKANWKKSHSFKNVLKETLCECKICFEVTSVNVRPCCGYDICLRCIKQFVYIQVR